MGRVQVREPGLGYLYVRICKPCVGSTKLVFMETATQTDHPYLVQLRDENNLPIGALYFRDLANAQGYAHQMLGFEKHAGLVCLAEILTKQTDGTFTVTEEMEF